MSQIATTTNNTSNKDGVSAKNIQSVCESLNKAYNEAAAAAGLSPDESLFGVGGQSPVDPNGVPLDMEAGAAYAPGALPMPPLPLPYWFSQECENHFNTLAADAGLPRTPAAAALASASSMGALAEEEDMAAGGADTIVGTVAACDERGGANFPAVQPRNTFNLSSSDTDRAVCTYKNCDANVPNPANIAGPTVVITDTSNAFDKNSSTEQPALSIVGTADDDLAGTFDELMNGGSADGQTAHSPSASAVAVSPGVASDSSTVVATASVCAGDDFRAKLKRQLEWYFSRENLTVDNYLRSQMDNDQYVPVKTVANFNMVKKMTTDLDLIVQLYRESSLVQVDEKGEKVRPVHKRCTLILREIPEGTSQEEVEQLFSSPKCPTIVSCEYAHNNSWYINFECDEHAQLAYVYLQKEVGTFKGRGIKTRIKTAPIPRVRTHPNSTTTGFPNRAHPSVLPLLGTQLSFPGANGSVTASTIVTPGSAASTPTVPPPFTAPLDFGAGTGGVFAVSQDSASTSTVSLNAVGPTAAVGAQPPPPPALVAASPVITPPWPGATAGPPQFFDLGHILALNGFQAQGTFRPSVHTVLLPAPALGPSPLSTAPPHHGRHPPHHYMEQRNPRNKRNVNAGIGGASGPPPPHPGAAASAYFYSTGDRSVGGGVDYEPPGRPPRNAGSNRNAQPSSHVGNWAAVPLGSAPRGGGDHPPHFGSFRNRQNASGGPHGSHEGPVGGGSHHTPGLGSGGGGYSLRVPDGGAGGYRSSQNAGGRGRGGYHYGAAHHATSPPNRGGDSGYHPNADYWSSKNAKDKQQQPSNRNSVNLGGGPGTNASSGPPQQAARKGPGGGSGGGSQLSTAPQQQSARRKSSGSTAAAGAAAAGPAIATAVNTEFDFQPSSFPPLPAPKLAAENATTAATTSSTTLQATPTPLGGSSVDERDRLPSAGDSESTTVSTATTTVAAAATTPNPAGASANSAASRGRTETFSRVLAGTTAAAAATAVNQQWPKAGATASCVADVTPTIEPVAKSSAVAEPDHHTTVVRPQRVVTTADKATATDSPVRFASNVDGGTETGETLAAADAALPFEPRLTNGPASSTTAKKSTVEFPDPLNVTTAPTATVSAAATAAACQLSGNKLSYAAMAKHAVDKATSATTGAKTAVAAVATASSASKPTPAHKGTATAPAKSSQWSSSAAVSNHDCSTTDTAIAGAATSHGMINGEASAAARHFGVGGNRRLSRSDGSDSPSAPLSTLRKYQTQKPYARNFETAAASTVSRPPSHDVAASETTFRTSHVTSADDQ